MVGEGGDDGLLGVRHPIVCSCPQRSWAIALQKQVVDKRHHFKPVPMSQATVCKTAKVPDDAYRALHSRDSLPFSSIVSTKPIADFNAPSASNRMNRAADLPMLRDAAARNDYRLPREAWRGVLADVKHKMIVCKMAATHVLATRTNPIAGGAS